MPHQISTVDIIRPRDCRDNRVDAVKEIARFVVVHGLAPADLREQRALDFYRGSVRNTISLRTAVGSLAQIAAREGTQDQDRELVAALVAGGHLPRASAAIFEASLAI